MNNSFISSFEPSQVYSVRKWHVLTFCLAFVVSLVVCECLNRHFILTRSSNVLTFNAFEKEKKEVKMLLIGDSQFLDGIDPHIFPRKTFNLSFLGTDYIQSYFMLKRQLDELPALKVLVLQMNLHSFSSFRSDKVYAPVFWNRFLDYDELVKLKGWPILRYQFEISFLTDSSGRKSFLINLMDVILGKNVQEQQKDVREKVYLVSADPVLAERRVYFHLKGYKTFDVDLLLYFEKILKLCRDRRIRVFTVQTPLSQYYLKAAQNYVTFRDLEEKVLLNPRFQGLIDKNFNYLELFPQKDNYFQRDGDHLNGYGRDKFSKILAKALDDLTKPSS
ncbi:MAG: hypothetical protein NC930_07730 [Candidatus Omnitrophica bacterium]|nr:hypothetical protein [Candidatus Omnitrophota bacterium]